MGFLLKIVVFGVAVYTLWMTVTRWYRLFSGRRPGENPNGPVRGDRPPSSQPNASQPQSQPQRAQIEDTYPCKICGVYVMASARKCERSDCPQPA
jgi:hypothetical protein